MVRLNFNKLSFLFLQFDEIGEENSSIRIIFYGFLPSIRMLRNAISSFPFEHPPPKISDEANLTLTFDRNIFCREHIACTNSCTNGKNIIYKIKKRFSYRL